ncbi:MAG: hypothetical protein C0467_31695 [Planctomycetaceae bacterium]|nr:hypothetical protein [Planctomycetaceae bacterium]
MRRFVTIAVAIVLVATCGPAPCPCHLIAILRPAAKEDARLPRPPRPACKCCHADQSKVNEETHTASASEADRTPDLPMPPCEHGPKVEFGSIGVLGELHVEVETDCVAAALSDPLSGSHAEFLISAQQFRHCLTPFPHLHALRFAHAFRS